MEKASVTVSSEGKHWKVEAEGVPCSHHFTKDAAKYAGLALARQMGAELVVNDAEKPAR
jgi:hypothetical protein